MEIHLSRNEYLELRGAAHSGLYVVLTCRLRWLQSTELP